MLTTAPLRLAQLRQEVLRAQKYAAHVHGHLPVPLLGRRILYGLAHLDRGVIDERVDRAVRGQRPAHQFLHRRRVGNIGVDSEPADLPRGHFRSGDIDIGDHHLRAFARRLLSACPPDA